MRQSKTSKVIADTLIKWHIDNEGGVPKVICAYGHPDMAEEVIVLATGKRSKQNADFGWGTRHRRNVSRINNALRQDSRFKECRVRGIRSMVGFDYLRERGV